MRIINRTKKIDRLLEVAGRAAISSTHHDHRHGAVLIKGGSILATGHNQSDFSKHAGLHRDFTEYSIGSLHAEIAVLRGLSKNTTQGSVVYVVRLGKKCNKFKMSRPCMMCMSALRDAGIKRVIFTVYETNIASITPRERYEG